MCTIEPDPPLEWTKIVGIAHSHRHPFLVFFPLGHLSIYSSIGQPLESIAGRHTRVLRELLPAGDSS
jgi:hypothetical protein